MADFLFRAGNDFRIDQKQRTRRLAFFLIMGVDDNHSFQNPDLRRGQSDPGGGVHGFKHIVKQPAQPSSTFSTGAAFCFSTGSGYSYIFSFAIFQTLSSGAADFAGNLIQKGVDHFRLAFGEKGICHVDIFLNHHFNVQIKRIVDFINGA